MSSSDVAIAVFERWALERKTLGVFTPYKEGEASFSTIRVSSVDKASGKAEILLLDANRSTTWPLASANAEYVDSSEDEDIPEELKRQFSGRFLKLEFSPTELFVVGELVN